MRTRRTLFLWILALAELLCLPALAAEGDFNFPRNGGIFQELGDYPRGGCTADGALYLYGDRHLYRYRDGDADFTALEYALPSEEGSGELRQMKALASDGETLYALCPVYGYVEGSYRGLVRLELATLQIVEDQVRFAAPVELDCAALTTYYGSSDAGELAPIDGALCLGGRMYLQVYTADGSQRIYALDLADGDGNFLAVENVHEVAGLDGDRLLIETYDSREGRLEFLIYDAESGALSTASGSVQADAPCENIAYSAESGRLFYMEGGYVMATEDFDLKNAVPVAELSTAYMGESSGILLPGDRYVYLSFFDGVSARATDPGALPEKQLVVQCAGISSSLMNANRSFNAAHSDAVAALREDYDDDASVVEAILNRDAAADVYILSASSEVYDALRAHGYLLALDGAAIQAATQDAYPAIREALSCDGELVAVPTDLSGWTLGLDYEGFEKIGIPRAEMPDNWIDFLDLLPTLPERLPEDGSVRIFADYYSQRRIRLDLLDELLDGWLLHLRAADQELRYDSPELEAAIDKLMALDLGALGLVKEGDPDEPYVLVSLVGGGKDRNYTLVEPSAGCTTDSFSFTEPALLSLIPGEVPPLPLSLTVAFANPYSENVELAQEYLAAICENLDARTLYNLSDRLNEPVRNSYYKQNMEDTMGELEASRAALEKADPVDKPQWEERIAQWEEQLADLEANSWDISPEGIEWYRARAENLAVIGYSYVDVQDAEGEFADLVEQLLSGRVDAAAFLQEIDRRVNMKEREGI